MTSSSSSLSNSAPPPLILQTPFARFSVGLVVALGFYLGLRDWSTAALMMSAELSTVPEWISLVVMLVARGVAVAIGSMMGGAGREQGAFTGLAVGGACGGLFAIIDVLSGDPASSKDVIIGGVLIAIGAGGGILGARVWPPAMQIHDRKKYSAKSSLIPIVQDNDEDEASPTQWWRVLIAAFVMIIAVSYADDLREQMRRIRGNQMSMASIGLAPVFTVQIAGVFVAAGGVIAGSCTRAGLRHGLLAGIIAGLGVVGTLLTGNDGPIPVLDGLTRISGLVIPNIYSAESGMLLFFSIVGVSSICGWFGSEVVPELRPRTGPKLRL